MSPFSYYILDGIWGTWSTWASCSVTCGGGSQARTRICNNPAPASGGATCPGSGVEFQSCNSQICSIVGEHFVNYEEAGKNLLNVLITIF